MLVIASEQLDDPTTPQFDGRPAPYEDFEAMAAAVLRRSDLRGPGPILQSLMRQDTSTEVREAARARLDDRLVAPLAEQLGTDAAAATLRSQLVVSALLGVSLARSLRWFDELADVERTRLVELLVEVLGPPGPTRRALALGGVRQRAERRFALADRGDPADRDRPGPPRGIRRRGCARQ